MEIFVLIIAIPILVAILAKIILHTTITWQEWAVQTGVALVVTLILWMAGTTQQTQDVQILNGAVISKHVDTGHYLRPYTCNCTQSCSGSGTSRSCYSTCQTCFENRYTKTWSAKTTVGDVTFEHLDRGRRSVWNTPDVQPYIDCKQGEPASVHHSYTNYVKAVPQSLFNTKAAINEQPLDITYPEVYNFYRVDRVIGPIQNEQTAKLNTLLNESLRELGPKKQVNIVVIVTDKDRNYRYQVENQWIGGKNNDVVIFVGMANEEIVWVDTMTWALNKGNEMFRVRTNESLGKLRIFDAQNIHDAVVPNVEMYYDRPHMSDFEYLKDDIKPPTWLLVTLVLLNLVGGLIAVRFFHINDIKN